MENKHMRCLLKWAGLSTTTCVWCKSVFSLQILFRLKASVLVLSLKSPCVHVSHRQWRNQFEQVVSGTFLLLYSVWVDSKSIERIQSFDSMWNRDRKGLFSIQVLYIRTKQQSESVPFTKQKKTYYYYYQWHHESLTWFWSLLLLLLHHRQDFHSHKSSLNINIRVRISDTFNKNNPILPVFHENTENEFGSVFWWNTVWTRPELFHTLTSFSTWTSSLQFELIFQELVKRKVTLVDLNTVWYQSDRSRNTDQRSSSDLKWTTAQCFSHVHMESMEKDSHKCRLWLLGQSSSGDDEEVHEKWRRNGTERKALDGLK